LQGNKAFPVRRNIYTCPSPHFLIAATYSLLYNGSLMVDEGIGYALCLNHIINPTGESNLCFRPLYPKLEIGLNVVWKKYQILNRASEKFLEKLYELI